jgi:hypothetical protein
MTLRQFIAAECANMHYGLCWLHENGECLAMSGKRCSYFEESVAPMKDQVTDTRMRDSIRQAVDEYRRSHGAVNLSGRKCQCGEVLNKGERYCLACKKRLRAETQARHYANSRNSDSCLDLPPCKSTTYIGEKRVSIQSPSPTRKCQQLSESERIGDSVLAEVQSADESELIEAGLL